MYLISKTRLYLLFTAIAVLIVLLTINSYYVFIALKSQPPLSSKYFAENVVFYAVIVLLFLAILLANTIARHKDILAELDKIVELSHKSPSVIQTQVNKLGLLGEKISQINANLNELNEVKSLKISAQSALIDFIFKESEGWLLLTDAEGRIVNFSRGLIDKLQMEKINLFGVYIDELLPDTDPSKLINNLRRTKGVTVKSHIVTGHNRATMNSVWAFFPILNSKGKLVYTVGILQDTPPENLEETEQLPFKEKPLITPENTQQAHIIDRITDYVRSKFERLKDDDEV